MKAARTLVVFAVLALSLSAATAQKNPKSKGKKPAVVEFVCPPDKSCVIYHHSHFTMEAVDLPILILVPRPEPDKQGKNESTPQKKQEPGSSPPVPQNVKPAKSVSSV